MTLYNYTFESGFQQIGNAINNIAKAIEHVAVALESKNQSDVTRN